MHRSSQMLQGKIAVVTGAANGIGRAISLRFAREGADVGLFDLDPGGLGGVHEEVIQIGRRACAVRANCADQKDVERAFKMVRDELGPIDILVNNVGQSARERTSEFASSDLGTLDFLLTVNLKSCIVCSRQVVDEMRTRLTGKIVNITSESAVNGSLRTWDYSAAKAGVIGFTRSIARELAPFGINVNAIAPGITRTRALEQLPADLIKRVVAAIPSGRMGEPDDVANAVAFFASDQSAYVTGQTLLVNGGNWFL
jgi:NAD(P)-dependent dehydrogenase (short-subunit alcohol dehydrogenase family)